MMKSFLAFAVLLLVVQTCSGRAAGDEDSVVSVYTTLPTSAGTGAPLNVYREIAGNLADRITQPIYRFFGIDNRTEEKTTKRPFEHIELGAPDETTKSKNDTNTTNNEIPDRDVEELSLDSVQKTDKKPEKFTLFSSYLPVKENLELNDTNEAESKDNDVDDNSLELDDVDSDDKETSREGAFIYFLELAGSIIQLLWGGFLALFKPSTSSS